MLFVLDMVGYLHCILKIYLFRTMYKKKKKKNISIYIKIKKKKNFLKKKKKKKKKKSLIFAISPVIVTDN